MKKHLLFVALLSNFLIGAVAQGLNPYAYDLKAVVANPTVSFSYSLNADATKVELVILDGTTTVKSIPLDESYQKAGNHTYDVNMDVLPAKASLTWKLLVTGQPVSAPTEFSKAYNFYHPQGVDVDNNFDSPHFGRILVTECMTPPNVGYQSSNEKDGKGLYAFDPQLTPIPNKNGTYGFKGGLTYEEKLPAGGTSYDPRKVRIAEDGRIFLSRQAATYSSLWEVNPDDLDADFSEVFKGTQDPASFMLKNREGKMIAMANVSMDVKGAGDDLKILLLQTTAEGLAFSYNGFSTDEYNLGKATSWEKEPSTNIGWLTGQFTIQGSSTNVLYDNEGGIWYVQYRGTPSDLQPAILHINAEGVEDYRDIKTVAGGAGVRFNQDFSLLAVANAKKQVGIYAVGKDADGKPTLTLKCEFPTTIGTNCNDMAWDVAQNLYIVGNSGEWLKVFVLPRDTNVAETLAPSNQALNLVATDKMDLFYQPVKVIGGNGYIDIQGEVNAVAVYSINGALVNSGDTHIQVASGIYFVKANGRTYKVVVK